MKQGALLVILGTALLALPGAPALAQGAAPPDAIAGFVSETLAPGVWRVLDDGTGAPLDDFMREIRVGPGGSVWVLARDGAFGLGHGALGPPGRQVDRLFAVDAHGRAWLREQRGGSVLHEGFGTWDGQVWSDRSGLPRGSALEPDPARAPRVIRDLALGTDGAVWVVAGEQDGPRWERFTVERLDEDGWTTWAVGEGLPSLPCAKNCGDGSRVLALDDGSVWVSVDQGGLLHFDGTEWQAVRPLLDGTDRPVHWLVGDPTGFMWAEIASGAGGADGLPGVVRARFDGSEWDTPAHAQVDAESPFDAERCPRLGSRCDDPWRPPRAVGPDGTLWSVGGSEDGQQMLTALDEKGRRVVPDLGLCQLAGVAPATPADQDPAGDAGGCWIIASVDVGPDGLVWVVAGTSPGIGDDSKQGALIVVDPDAALQGAEAGA